MGPRRPGRPEGDRGGDLAMTQPGACRPAWPRVAGRREGAGWGPCHPKASHLPSWSLSPKYCTHCWQMECTTNWPSRIVPFRRTFNPAWEPIAFRPRIAEAARRAGLCTWTTGTENTCVSAPESPASPQAASRAKGGATKPGTRFCVPGRGAGPESPSGEGHCLFETVASQRSGPRGGEGPTAPWSPWRRQAHGAPQDAGAQDNYTPPWSPWKATEAAFPINQSPSQ